MSKFNTTITKCTGNVVVGDNAVLTIGARPAEGKENRISRTNVSHVLVKYFTSGFSTVDFFAVQLEANVENLDILSNTRTFARLIS